MADSTIGNLGARAAVLTTDLMPLEPNAGPPAEKATIAQLVTLLDTIYGTGPFLPLAGGTMVGAILFSADNTIDIGASGATRPRTGYFGTSLVTALVASPAATALQFASAGTNRANFSTAGHLLWNTDNTYDIGANSTTRPRSIFAGSDITAGSNIIGAFVSVGAGGYFYWNSRCNMTSPANSIIRFTNAAETDFDRLQLGGSTSAFPSLKRSTTVLQSRLADDSAFGTFQGIIQVSVNATAAAPPVTTHTIPLTDAAGQVYRVPCLV